MATGATTMAGRTEAEARAAHDTRAHVQPGRGSGGRPRPRTARHIPQGWRHAHQGSPRRAQRQPQVARRADTRSPDACAPARVGPRRRCATSRRRSRHRRYRRARPDRRRPDRSRHWRRWRWGSRRGLRSRLAALTAALAIAVPGARGGADPRTEPSQRAETVPLGLAFAGLSRQAQRLHLVVALTAAAPTIPVDRLGVGGAAVRSPIGGQSETQSQRGPSRQLGARPSTTGRGTTVRGRATGRLPRPEQWGDHWAGPEEPARDSHRARRAHLRRPRARALQCVAIESSGHGGTVRGWRSAQGERDARDGTCPGYEGARAKGREPSQGRCARHGGHSACVQTGDRPACTPARRAPARGPGGPGGRAYQPPGRSCRRQ